MKWQLIIMLMLMLPTVMATVYIEYSEDNETNWRNITDVDEDEQEGYQINLEARTLYYFRARNGTTDEWQYLSQITEYGGLNQMLIALAIFGVLLMIIGLYLFFRAKGNEATTY